MSYKFEVIDPADYYVVTSTYFKDDFSEMAKFILLDGDLSSSNASGGPDLNLDFLVHNVTIPLFEYHKIDGHIGDTFGIQYFGRAQLLVNFESTLIDTMDNYGKAHAVQLYRDVLRPKAVARTGVAPVLVFPGMAFQGTVMEIIFTETSDTPTTIGMSMRMLVLRMLGVAPENSGAKDVMFDYTVTPARIKPASGTSAASPSISGSAQPAALAAAEAAMNASNAASLAEADAFIQQQVAAENAMAMDNLGLPTIEQATPAATSAVSTITRQASDEVAPAVVHRYDQARQDAWNNAITNSL